MREPPGPCSEPPVNSRLNSRLGASIPHRPAGSSHPGEGRAGTRRTGTRTRRGRDTDTAGQGRTVPFSRPLAPPPAAPAPTALTRASARPDPGAPLGPERAAPAGERAGGRDGWMERAGRMERAGEMERAGGMDGWIDGAGRRLRARSPAEPMNQQRARCPGPRADGIGAAS